MYASFSLDTSSNRGWFQRKIMDPRLIKLAAALSPAVLRIGGTGNNCLKYNVPASAPKVSVCYCMSSFHFVVWMLVNSAVQISSSWVAKP